jgi:hypothetical protein
MADEVNISARDGESILPEKLRYEASRDLPDDISNDAIAYLRMAADEIERLREVLEAILDSDMAMREEDEGRVSAELDRARKALSLARGDSQ